MAEFDRFAADYRSTLDRSVALAGETSEYFVASKAAYVDGLLDTTQARKILDYGCGIGILMSALARRRPHDEIHGFDVSLDSLERVDPDVRGKALLTSRLEDLHDDYDLIVLSNVMHHIPPAARQATVADLAARLAHGGKLLVIEHNPLNPLTRWVVSHCEFDDDAVLLWPGEVRRYLAAAGLRSARRDYMVFFPKALSALRRFEPALAWCPAGAQYALSAQAPGTASAATSSG